MRWYDGAIVLLFSLLAIVSCRDASSDSTWIKLQDGIYYNKTSVQQKALAGGTPITGTIHAFRIDPKKFKFDVITAKQLNLTNLDARTMTQKTGAILAVNGGFFTPEYTPLGLIVKNGTEINRLKWTSWWHIFQVRGGAGQIITKNEYTLSPDIEMALEAGPRLIINGAIPQLKESTAERSAMGITNEGEIVIAVTEASPMPLARIASHLQRLGCRHAINLDGGGSTQIYAKVKGFELNRPGLTPVANGIGVFPR